MKKLHSLLSNGNEVDVSNQEHKTLPNCSIKLNKQNNRFELFNYMNNEVYYSFNDLDSLIRLLKQHSIFNGVLH